MTKMNWNWLRLWQGRVGFRIELNDLSDSILRDIGLLR